MFTTELRIRTGSLLAWGGAIIALAVTDRVSADPVNVGKMLLLTVFSGAILGLLLTEYKSLGRESRLLLFLLISFNLVLCLSILLSTNAWERGLYGAYGRNTGLLTYLGLSIFLFASTVVKEIQIIEKIIKGFILVALLNIVYNLLVIFDFDVFTWINPYGKPIGTFGNPNFISSFLGMFVTSAISILVLGKLEIKRKIFLALTVPFSIFIVFKTGSLQGFVVMILGIAVVSLFYIWFRLKNLRFFIVYSAFIVSGGIFSILGMLQKGPLATLLYKPSVSIRGEYWAAGINMGFNKPLFGQGLDSYGIYFRRFREESAAVFPGLNVVTDAAHNIFIDIFSGSGFAGLILYTGIFVFTLNRSLNYVRIMKSADPVFITLFSTWICYQAQSLISINQIGLAVWGWIFTGLLIGYPSMSTSIRPDITQKKAPHKAASYVTPPKMISAAATLSIFFGMALGLIVALPPFLTDAKMRKALSSGNADAIVNQASAFPIDSLRVNRAVVSLANAGLTDIAREVTLVATRKYPDDFAGWSTLYALTSPVNETRAELKKILNEIDPLNPDWK